MTKKTGKWLGLMIHHSAGSQSDTVESIRRIHKAKGWGDIGYSYVLEIKDGRGYLKPGRSLDYVGAHAGVGYYNKNYIGLCVPGNYSKSKMSYEIYQDLLSAASHLYKKFGLSHVRFHREVKSTECPGLLLDPDQFRADLSKKLGIKIVK